MDLHCPTCSAPIDDEDISILSNNAYCQSCDNYCRLSDLPGLDDDVIAELNAVLNAEPKHIRFEQLPTGFRIRTNPFVIFSWFVIPITCIASYVFMSEIYGAQISQRRFELGMSLIGVPIVIGLIFMCYLCVMSVFGGTTVTVEGDDLTIVVGALGFGKRLHYKVSDFHSIREGYAKDNPDLLLIFLDGSRHVHFGDSLEDSHVHFVYEALQQNLGLTPITSSKSASESEKDKATKS